MTLSGRVSEIRQEFAVRYTYPVCFTRAALDPDNPALPNVFREGGAARHRVLVVADQNLLAVRPNLLDAVRRFASAHQDLVELVGPVVAVVGGEPAKRGLTTVRRLQRVIERHGLCRQSFLLAIGGGAVLDAVGYAAGTAHRGIRLVRMPTTVLGQNDAGVGVKNSVNAFGKKNFLGTFAPPFAVVNDFDFLATLPARELRAGIAEAVKVALIRDAAFFRELCAARDALAAFEPRAMEPMIVRCASLHLEHIRAGGDPFEFGSARPLDFGHWSAHRLEVLTAGEVGHGEAVALGVALDSLYSYRRGLLSREDLEQIFEVLEGVGFRLHHPGLAGLDIAAALEEFREHLGGSLSITLLAGLGRGVEVGEIDCRLMEQCVEALGERA
ncbi:MAG: 3-dehydroquinate synthase [Deltaproteobacteria bacterium]|nr:3-dehydroquinate synthase [Deltaproteobacteria bacterium]